MASESVSARERVTSLYAAREAMETEMASIAGRCLLYTSDAADE